MSQYPSESGQAPAGYPGPETPATATGAPVLSIVAFVLSAVAILFIPPIFGGAAIICAVVAMRRGERLGKLALIVAITATVIGLVLGFLVGAMSATSGR